MVLKLLLLLMQVFQMIDISLQGKLFSCLKQYRANIVVWGLQTSAGDWMTRERSKNLFLTYP